MPSLGISYSPTLGASSAGSPASSGGNVTTMNKNTVLQDAQTSRSTVHLAVAVVIFAVVALALGRGWLRNARIF